jgi:Domain of unknown function (DUF4349)
MTNQYAQRFAALVAAGLGLAVLLTGCGSSKTSASGTSSVPAPADAKAPASAGDRGVAAAPNAAGGGQTGVKTDPGAFSLPPQAVSRSVIYNGAITVRVHEVQQAATAAAALAVGGYVSGDNRTENGGQSVATVVLRVPAAQFTGTMDALHRLGQEKSRQVSTQDVTGQVVDVNARLKTEQASVDRIRALLAQATTVGQIVSIESELTQREADLESLEAQLRSLTDLTALSTITATLLGPEAAVTKPVKQTGFVAGLKAGWHAFVVSMTALVNIIGAVLPFALIIGVPLYVLWRMLRRRRTPRPALATAPAVAPDAASPNAG